MLYRYLKVGWVVTVVLSLCPLWTQAEEDAPIQPGLRDVVTSKHFLYRPGRGYTNYGFRDYEISQDVLSGNIKRNYYDPLGEFLISGRHLFTWTEVREAGAIDNNTSILKEQGRWNTFQRVIIGFDSYRSWNAALIMGIEIQSHFTPLTLDMADFNGVRLDVQTPQDDLTLMASRIGNPGQFTYAEALVIRNSAMALAGHYERKIGALRLGASFVNQHGFDSRQDDLSVRGGLQSDQVLPSYVVVRISDDSPRDGRGGPVVQDMRVFVNGEYRPDLQPYIIKTNSELPSVLGIKDAVTGEFRRVEYSHQGTKYAECLFFLEHLAGQDVSRNVNVAEMQRFFQLVPKEEAARADGYDVLLYYVDLTHEDYVRSVRFEALMGNDYRVDVYSIQEVNEKAKTPDQRYGVGGFLQKQPEVGGQGQTIHQISREPVAIRADGNVQDLSNMKRVSFEAGKQTGMSIVGANLNLDLRGLKVNAEYAMSFTYQQYPDGRPGKREARDVSGVHPWRGSRFHRTAPSYYVNAIKTFGQFELGGEYFSMHPNYNVGYVYEMIQDNDDNDRWTDRGSYFRQMGLHTGDPFSDPDGVFPGNDEDHDGIPDTNRDGDAIPDYDEPFLMYDVESNDYAYGPDLNNNGVPDGREDDLDPDLPYDRDLRGYHVFGRLRLAKGLSVTLGKLDAKGFAGGGNNQATYGGADLEMHKPALGDMFLHSELRRIHDDIEDPYRTFKEMLGQIIRGQIGWWPSGNLGYDYFDAEDQRFFRNSLANRNYLRLTSKRFRGLMVDGKCRFDINWQRETVFSDGTYQAKDRVSWLAMVNKADYIWRLSAKWRLIGQAKLLVLREDRQSLDVALRDEWTFMPILKASYQVTPDTEMWAGVHGFPGMDHRFKDRAKPRESFRQQTFVAQLINRSRYFGYNITTMLGVERNKRTYDDVLRQEENMDTFSAFLRSYLSFGQ